MSNVYQDAPTYPLGRETARGVRCVVTGKRCRTQEEQLAWLLHYRAHKRPEQPRLRMYLCDVCNAWHVTKRKARA